MSSDNSQALPIVGPGSQPTAQDETELDILQLPSEMQTYEAPNLPEPEAAAGMQAALDLLHQVQRDLKHYRVDQEPLHYDLRSLSDDNRQFIGQILGEGEVSIIFAGVDNVNIQEAAMAGLWRIKGSAGSFQDALEVGPVPAIVRHGTFADAQKQIAEQHLQLNEGVGNAIPLISEINDHCLWVEDGHTPHIINLTLLPQSEADLAFLQHSLGPGKTQILSRGYGNCRISSTNTQHVWWVQYFNSQDKNILNTLEITSMPEAAKAAQEDLADSAVRLAEILEIYA